MYYVLHGVRFFVTVSWQWLAMEAVIVLTNISWQRLME
jgi:hypothetical protein